MNLTATRLTDGERSLRSQVRSWVEERMAGQPPSLGAGSPADRDFSRDLAAKGWVGMTLPTQFGGGGRTAVERLVVTEELLAAGAPVGFHWVADRQCGPGIAMFGSMEQKERYLPAISRGEACFAIGMSEPDAGSDLASIKTNAKPDGRGWVVNGTKIWTSHAALATQMIVLARTSSDRHGGLSRFIVDLPHPAVTISPITFIDRTSDFCEVSFVEARLPEHALLGEVGSGWAQNTHELALERSGADRWMSAVPLLERWTSSPEGRNRLGAEVQASLISRMWLLRSMSLAIARMVDQGLAPVLEAAMVKELGTRFEQDCVRLLAGAFGRPPLPIAEDPYETLLAQAVLVSPSWTVRGGTTEVLRSIIAKGGMRR